MSNQLKIVSDLKSGTVLKFENGSFGIIMFNMVNKEYHIIKKDGAKRYPAHNWVGMQEPIEKFIERLKIVAIYNTYYPHISFKAFGKFYNIDQEQFCTCIYKKEEILELTIEDIEKKFGKKVKIVNKNKE